MREERDQGNRKYQVKARKPMTVLRDRYALGAVSWSDTFSIEYYAADRKESAGRIVRELFPPHVVQRMSDGTVSCLPGHEEEWEKAGKRFRREAQVLLLFKEDGERVMPELMDMFEEGGTVYQVYDDPGAVTIRKMLEDRGRPFHEKELRPYVEKLFEAVHQAHMRGILLLNLRADRITISDDGTIHLPIFGNVPGNMRNAVIAGSFGEAPERRQDGQKIGPFTDIYELGALIVEMLGFSAGHLDDRESLAGLACSERLRQVLEKAVRRDPDERYQTVDEFRRAYEGSLRRPIRRWVLPAAAAVVGITTFLLSGAGSFLLQGTREWLAEDHPEGTVSAQNIPDYALYSEESAIPEEVESAAEVPGEEQPFYAAGEEVAVQPGTYIIEYAGQPDLVLGIDSGFGDNGARALLTTERNRNCEKFYIEDAGNSWYYIKASHTGSFLTAETGPDSSEPVHQDAQPSSRRRWKFLYLEGESGSMTVAVAAQGGGCLSPSEGIIQGGCGTRLMPENEGRTGWKLIWSEFDQGEGTVPVYETGQLVEGLEGIHSLEYAADQSMCLAMSQASDLPEKRAIVWKRSGDETQQFEFRREEESRYRIFPVSQEGGIRKCLEYDPDSGTISSRAPGESQNQLFRIRYAGYNLYILQAADEGCLGAEPRNDGDFNGKYILSIPWEAYVDPLRCEWFIRDSKGI